MIEEPYIVEEVHSLSWADDRRESVNCFVKFNHSKHPLPFNASPNDPELHGRILFHRIERGDFGEIATTPCVLYTLSVGRRQEMLPILGPEAMSIVWLAIEEGNLENERGTARGIVLVWGALIEAVMAEVIRSRLGNNLPPDTFKRKVEILERAGLIDSVLLARLDDLREIRNCAAHSLRFSAFVHLEGDTKAMKAYSRLYAEVAEELFYEVSNLLFIARFVFAPACLDAVQRMSPLLETTEG